MLKNVAGQKIGCQMVSAADGSAFTGSVTVYVTGDAGTQAAGSVGSGACTHEGNGYHSYAPAQAETNYDLIAFTFTGSGAVPVTLQVFTRITPGAAGGAFIAGTNAATTIDSVNILNTLQIQGLTTFHEGVVIDSDSGYGLTITGLSGAISASSVSFSGTFAVTGAVSLTNAGNDIRGVDIAKVSGDSTAADNLELFFDGNGYAAANSTVGTVTTLTNLPAITSNWLTAAGLASDAVTEIQSGLATASALTIIDDFLDTEIAAIKAQTDLIPASPASTTNITAGTITNLTNLPAITANWLTAAGLASDAVTEIQSGLATAAALTVIDDFLDTEVAAIKAVTDKLDTAMALDGAVYQFTVNALELAPSGGGSAPTVEEIEAYLAAEHGSGSWESGGTGSGARSVTVTVDDGTDELESARVRFTKGGESYVSSTNASGVATFSLDDGTWTVTITLAGYTFTPTTLVVNGTETATYSMTEVVITPSPAGFTTGYLTVYDENGEIEPGAIIYQHMTQAPTGSGYAFDTTIRSAAADSNGLVEFPGMVLGGYYATYRTLTHRNRQTGKLVPLASGATLALDNIYGEP